MVLTVPDEESLRRIAERLESAGVRHVQIKEPDAPWRGAMMALGVAPGRKEGLRQHFASLPLLR